MCFVWAKRFWCCRCDGTWNGTDSTQIPNWVVVLRGRQGRGCCITGETCRTVHK